MSGDIRQAILDFLKKSSEKGKRKTYINQMPKEVPEFPKPEVRKAVQDMIAEGILSYWSSGSTTYVMLKEDFEKYRHDMEDAPAE